MRLMLSASGRVKLLLAVMLVGTLAAMAAYQPRLRDTFESAGLVTSVAFSPDGKMLASGSWDNSIKLWDVATGKNTATLKGLLWPTIPTIDSNRKLTRCFPIWLVIEHTACVTIQL